MANIINQIEIAKKQPLTPENLNYIGDLYLKMGDKQTAISYFYELAEKLHISQKDKKLAIYKKILNISTSESKAYEKIINIFSRMGLVAEEKKYLLMLSNLYQNKGEYNKLDALFRRIKEIDSEDQIAEKYFTKGKQDTDSFNRKPVSAEKEVFTSDVTNAVPEETTENIYIADKESMPSSEQREQVLEDIHTTAIQEQIKTVKDAVISTSDEKGKKFSFYIGISFLLILFGFSLYLYKGKIDHSIPSSKIKETTLQTGNYEITVMELKALDELTGKIGDTDRKENIFYVLSVKAKKSCLDDHFVASPYSMISFIDKNGKQFRIKDIKGLDSLTRTISRTHICGKDVGAVFMRVILAHDKKIHYSGMVLAGLEKDKPTLIKWD